ncbi:MAG: DASS family sodium-coupled anion symporter [Austwickia sp.]|nr:DASS family sodium-coupled anion symporter [Austwickia sp.]
MAAHSPHAVPGAHLHGLEPDPHRGEAIDHQSEGARAPQESVRTTFKRRLGLIGGLVMAVALYVLLPDDLSHQGKLTAATAVLMGIWWMTEAIPIPATALLPLAVFPTLGTNVTVNAVGASYGNSIIFLFMGGFVIALAMQRWNLHRRIALHTVRLMGTRATRVVGGFMIATAFLSMWVSNTATAVMMIPIGVSVLLLVGSSTAADSGSALQGLEGDASDPASQRVKDAIIESNFGSALMLGIAYAASLGSLGTIIGTPPNTLLVGYLRDNHDINIGFGQWMAVGVPLAIVFTALAWFLLAKVLFPPEIQEIPGGRALLNTELEKLGPMSSGEKRVLGVFVLAALSWVALPLVFDKPPVDDTGVAVIAALLLFLLPAGAQRGVRLIDWDAAAKLPWGVLLLFGGGLALSAQFGSSGLTKWIGGHVEGLGWVPVVVLVGILALGVLFLTELTSNTATAATFLPVAGGVALGLGLPPLLLTIPVALAATCAFMLPVATPPNAIAYGSGYVTIAQMIRGGVLLNLIGVVLITAVTMTLAVWVFALVY